MRELTREIIRSIRQDPAQSIKDAVGIIIIFTVGYFLLLLASI